MDAKFDIAEQYFEVIKYRMTATFVPDHDIDKLFVVMKKKHQIEPSAKRTLTRAEAVKRYHY